MRVASVLEAAAGVARENAAEATPWEARLLLAHSVGHGRPLHLDPLQEVPPNAETVFRELWERRVSGVPVQHLVGEWDFFGRPFTVDGRALVPRPETELLLETALAEAPGAGRALDLGTGSGVVAVTWLLERRGARAVAVDASTDALALALVNARRHGVADRLQLCASDWTSAIAESARFDVALSNPPYLPLGDAPGLAPTVRDYDPAAALFSGEDGLDAIRRLLEVLPRHLAAGSPFVFEIGAGQASPLEREVAARSGWRLEKIVPDLASIPRIAVARRT